MKRLIILSTLLIAVIISSACTANKTPSIDNISYSNAKLSEENVLGANNSILTQTTTTEATTEPTTQPIITTTMLTTTETTTTTTKPTTTTKKVVTTKATTKPSTTKPKTTTAKVVSSSGKNLGSFKITVYTPGADGGGWGYQTATGVRSKHLQTCAVDPSVIPLGSKIYVNGLTLTACDTGGAIKGKHIDIFYDGSNSAACKWADNFGYYQNVTLL